MHRLAVLSLFAVFLSFATFSQDTVSGFVKNESGEALAGVTVKAYVSNKIIGFGRSDNAGNFSFNLRQPITDTLKIIADKIGFERLERIFTEPLRSIELSMHPTSAMLREVTVEAPRAKMRGDTVSFRLGAFTGNSDQTLEDGLKRLPGVEVAESGKISYMGKEISDFYVENLQLVGSRYNLITRNMPAEYVTDVELIENHQAAAMDKGRPSDNVAMNVKLSNKAKFKPIGTAEAMTGVRHKEFLYRVVATGMMFSPKFQTLLTLKGGNYNKDIRFSQNDLLPNYPLLAEGQLSGSNPPLSSDDYSYNRDLGVSVNFLRAFNSTDNLRINIGYNNDRKFNYYSQNSIYPVGDGMIEFYEYGSPRSESHLPYLAVGYVRNHPTKYIANNFTAAAEIKTNDFNLVSDGNDYRQHQQIRSLSLSESFSWRKKIGTKSYTFSTGFAYLISPKTALDVFSPEVFSAIQNASGATFKWKGTTAFDWRKDLSIWSLPIDIDFMSSRLRTSLFSYADAFNNAASTETNIRVAPTYEMVTRNRKFSINLSLGTGFQSLHIRNRRSDARSAIDRLLFDPSLQIVLNPTSRFSVKLTGSINHQTGDILDILTEEIMNDFRTVSTASGVIGTRRIASFTLRGEYKDAVNLFFSDVSAGFSRIDRNTINALSVTEQDVEQAVIFFDNSSDNFTTSAMLSKHFVRQGLQFSVRGTYLWAKGYSLQQGELITSFSQSYNISPTVNVKPLKYFEIHYNGSIGKNFTRFDERRSGFFSMTNNLKLSVYPVSGWDLFAESSFIRKEITDGVYKDFSLFNAGVTWKHKKFRFTLKADNLLDIRNYSYTVFNGINIFSYDFRLTGRALTFKCSINL
ncbi:MAG: TonB-dependent receptor [Paramuribaculum sp.]|nr:TonB-dependent receptor [Paramuribaculum sp.]